MLSNIKKSINPPNVSKRDIWGLDSSPLTIELSKEKKKVYILRLITPYTYNSYLTYFIFH